MNQILYSKKPNLKPIIIIVALIVVIIAIIVCFGFGIANKFSDKILKGVYVANVNVSNLTKEKAIEAINDEYSKSNRERKLSLIYKDTEFTISTSEIGYGYTDAEELAQEAYNYGRNGNLLENNFTVLGSYFNKEKIINNEEKIDIKKLESAINYKISGENSFSNDDTYEVSGDKLILTKGTEGRKIDFEKLAENIITALKNRDISADIPVIVSEPNTIDIDEIYLKVHKEPVNASYKEGKNFEIIKEENGLDFDVDEAKKKYYALNPGESVEIELEVTEPMIKVEDLGDSLFKTVIASYTSKNSAYDKNMMTNMQLAAEKCNNKVLYPDEEFSFNDIVGQRTAENGYRESDSFDNGKIEQSIGGGVCQVASTIYNAVLRTDLKITDRTAHPIYVKYVPQGTDAMVVDGSSDFKFKNTTKYPVKIAVSCENGSCTVNLFGIQESNEIKIDVDVKILETKSFAKQTQDDATMTKGTSKVIQSGIEGYVSEVYRVYSKNGKETSRKLVSKDTYLPIAEISKVGTKVVTTRPTTPKPVVTPKPVQTQTPVIVVTPKPVDTPNPNLPEGWDSPENPYANLY